MYTITHEKKIKVHTIQIDDTEVLNYQHHPDDWIDLLDSLLIAKAMPNGDSPVPAKRAKKTRRGKENEELIPCPKCGLLVKPRGLLRHQCGSKCKLQAHIQTPQD